jgi:hypothetical protein
MEELLAVQSARGDTMQTPSRYRLEPATAQHLHVSNAFAVA